MKDGNKTNDQLIGELLELRQRVAELEAPENDRKLAEEESQQKERYLEDQLKALLSPGKEPSELKITEIVTPHVLKEINDAFAKVFDVTMLLTDAEGNYIAGPKNLSEFCQLIRRTEKGLARCEANDKTLSKRAKDSRGPIITRCSSAGLIDAVLPIRIGGRHVASWLVGQFCPPEVDQEKIRQTALEIGVDEKKLLAAYHKLEKRPIEHLKRSLKLLEVFAQELSEYGLNNLKLVRAINERKQSEEALKKSEERYQNLIESANVGIIVSENETIIQVNKEAEEIYGYSRGELAGKSAVILTTEKHRKKHSELFKEIIDLGKMKKAIFEEEGIRKDGTLFPVEISFSLAQAGGNTSIAVMRDISDRKEMEHKLLQSEKLRSLGELAGGVAHDFNNVLAAILGRAQLLKMVIQSPEGVQEKRKSIIELKEGLDVIEQASRDGAETVRRIQEFARRRADDKHFGTVDLNAIIDNAIDFTKTRWKGDAESKGIKINIQKELSTLPTTSGSASELREVVTNLINNAVDAMPQGGEIKIKTYKENSHIVVNVEDTGVGIPKALRARIFDPFFTTKGVQSTGLGMSVSYGIINRHRGTISVDSVEGQGTTFTIKLPVPEKVIGGEKVKRIESETRKARIMVIDDEENIQDILSDILKKGGHEVEVVSDGSQGIEIFEKKEFDLVFTDLGMPGMSGWQVAEKVKGINGRVPVILITGWDIKKETAENKDNWVDLIIHKPFEMDQVLNTVQEGMILRDRFKAV